MCADKDDGRVEVSSKDNETKLLTAKGLSGENMTCSSLKVKSPSGATLVWIGSDEDGGRVIVYGKDRKSMARMGIDEHGGVVAVGGKFGNANTQIPE